jgi:hypothetical protein
MTAKTTNNEKVSVHTLQRSPLEDAEPFTDHGRLVRDLGALGLDLYITTKKTFTEGSALRVRSSDGGVQLEPVTIDGAEIRAMHNRIIDPNVISGTENLPMLNSYNMKDFAGSKMRLYDVALRDYQPPTQLIDINNDSYENIEAVIESVASPEVVLKSNSGSGGGSIKILDKKRAMEWVDRALKAGDAKPQIVQPKVKIGALPDGIRAISPDDRALVDKVRREKSLAELRMFVVKRGQEFDLVPILRAVVEDDSQFMTSHNDAYIDVELPDDLHEALSKSTKDIINKVTAQSGDKYALGAVDFYFDEHGLPMVMEGNFRNPALPLTAESQVAGRKMHLALAKTLAQMSAERTS